MKPNVLKNETKYHIDPNVFKMKPSDIYSLMFSK